MAGVLRIGGLLLGSVGNTRYGAILSDKATGEGVFGFCQLDLPREVANIEIDNRTAV